MMNNRQFKEKLKNDIARKKEIGLFVKEQIASMDGKLSNITL